MPPVDCIPVTLQTELLIPNSAVCPLSPRVVQVRLAEEIKVKTDAGDFMGMFNVMKNQTSIIRQAMNEENQRCVLLGCDGARVDRCAAVHMCMRQVTVVTAVWSDALSTDLLPDCFSYSELWGLVTTK